MYSDTLVASMVQSAHATKSMIDKIDEKIRNEVEQVEGWYFTVLQQEA